MAESLTISRQAPPVGSMNYALLREQGVNRLQELSGKQWTDFNIHDPGITVLEALAYAITDLGYRSSYKIQDLIALAPGDTQDIRNFFSAYEILTNRALTPEDYRKLLIDVQVTDPDTNIKAGVKNAWLMKAESSEIPFYVNTKGKALSYFPDPKIPNQQPIKLRGLYNVLLEFDENARFGDMNENIMTGTLQVTDNGCGLDPKLFYKNIVFEITLPRWDKPGVDWNDQSSIRSYINKQILIDFSGYPDNYLFNYSINPTTGAIENLYAVEDQDRDGQVLIPFANPLCLENLINDFLYNVTTGLVEEYQRKVKLIFRLVDEVRRTLMANRNLCEDFLNLSAVKVEEISMCGEIVIANDYDIEEVLANIYHEIGKFLSPTVYFHTLDEMIARGNTTDEIFLGPRLKHGFIDGAELEKATFRESIHVSDLYRIIMNVKGVIAVKKLQIANFPEETDAGIKTRSVKWCLELAFAKNFIPRLSVERSSVVIYKDVLPFEPDQAEVLRILAELKLLDPPQRLENPVLDIPIPQGEFKELDSYVSVQEDFPLVYGIGPEGLPDSATPLRKAQAKQLKGFLMFFDQLLANYFSQLSHVKDLFSLSQEKDNAGNYIIGRTYYAQTLINIVPDAAALYVNSQPVHVANLNLIAEDDALFETRRNRFLDHLLARFGETFTDYALLAYTLEGPRANDELIEDKLRFLNNYPQASSERAGAFDYENRCLLWNVENASGLEQRASLLAGIDPFDPSDLIAPLHVNIIDTAGGAPYSFTVDNILNVQIMTSVSTYNTLDEVMLAAEKTIVAGLFAENYFFFDSLGDPNVPIDPVNPPVSNAFFYKLYCHEEILAVSQNAVSQNIFIDIPTTQADIAAAMVAFREDYDRLPSSNRRDLDCALEDYLTVTTTPLAAGDGCPDRIRIDYILKNEVTALNPVADNILEYSVTVPIKPGEPMPDFIARVNASIHDLFLEFLLVAADRSNYRLEISGGDYVFSVIDTCKESIASSVEIAFNTNLAAFLPGPVRVYDEDGVEVLPAPSKTFSVGTSAEDNDKINIVMAPASVTVSALPVTYTGGKISKTFTVNNPTLTDLFFDEGRRRITVTGDLRGRVKVEDLITAVINSITYNLTVVQVAIVDFTGSYKTEITVKENFTGPYTTGDSLTNTFFVPVIAVVPGSPPTNLVLKGGVDEIAIDEFIEFIRAKFLGHEGMHLIEHILLRPTTKKKVFDPATITTLTENLTPQGDLFYLKTVTINAVNMPAKIFTAAGNVTTEIQPLQTILVKNSNNNLNDKSYTVLSVTPNGGDTDIKVKETISDNTVPFGDITFTKKVAVYDVDAPTKTITIDNVSIASELPVDTVIILKGSQDEKNDTRYQVFTATDDPFNLPNPQTDIVIKTVEIEHKDNFLLINQVSECEDCRYEDPYSFVASVILPFWRGRFSKMNFRNFFERTLRLETPAHIALNICWIGCEQMKEFEKRYKLWLYLHAQKVKDPVALSDAQHALIDILQNLRSVYPKGTLHDCELDDQLKNSIVLNRSTLGTI
jgi:hypothetical protein